MKDTVLSRVFFVCRFPTRPESAYFQWTGVHLCSCVFWGESVGRDDPNCVRACMTSFDAENCRRRFRYLEVYTASGVVFGRCRSVRKTAGQSVRICQEQKKSDRIPVARIDMLPFLTGIRRVCSPIIRPLLRRLRPRCLPDRLRTRGRSWAEPSDCPVCRNPVRPEATV